MGRQSEATVTWIEGMRFSGSASGHQLDLDASIEHGGVDAGFRPLELLLVGMGGCTAMDVISMLRKMRQDVTCYQVVVTGDRADEHPMVYTTIRVEHVLTGRGLQASMVERAIGLSKEKYCPAMAMLGQSACIETSYRIVEEEKAEVEEEVSP